MKALSHIDFSEPIKVSPIDSLPKHAKYAVQELTRGVNEGTVIQHLIWAGVPEESARRAVNNGKEFVRAHGSSYPLPPELFNRNPVAMANFQKMVGPYNIFSDNLTIRKPHPRIWVIDGFLNDKVFDVVKKDVKSIGLTYGKISNIRNDDIESGFWYKAVVTQQADGRRLDAAKDANFRKMPYLDKIWSQATALIGPRNLVRVYSNGQTFGTDPTAHRDDPRVYRHLAGEENFPATILMYMNDEWNKDWAGETVFFDDDNEIITSVLPKKGRAVVFDGTIMHAARPVSRYCRDLRQILVFKTTPYSFDGNDDIYSIILSATQNIRHSDGWFSDHLNATASILASYGAPKYLVEAGLCHSCYGTSYFDAGTILPKETLKEIIGERAENLVEIFCNLEKRTTALIERGLNVTDDMYRDLLIIEHANLDEQSDRVETIRSNGKLQAINAILKERFSINLPIGIKPYPMELLNPGLSPAQLEV